MSIADLMARSPSAGIFPSATPAMNSLQVSQKRGLDAETLQRRLDYQEALKDLDNKAMERAMKKRKLEFELANQDELMAGSLNAERVKLSDPVLDNAARDIPFVRNEQDYGVFLQKHQNILSQMPELLGPDGAPKPFKEALPELQTIRQRRVYSIDHQQALELAETRASAMQPGMPAPNIDPRQQDAAFSSTRKYLKQEGIDLGDQGNADGSDVRELSYAVGQITEQVNQAAAKLGAKKVNEHEIRQKILEVARKHIKDNRFNIGKWINQDIKTNVPGRQDWTIDWSGFNEEVNSTFGLSTNYGSGQQSNISTSGPAVLTNPDIANPAKAPQGAIDKLMANPDLAPAFKAKYGYLPEGFE